MVEWVKLSKAIGSGTADPVQSSAATTQSIPAPVVGNKPAPGMTGPKGLSPRTSYTRVNTGAPPVPDAGAMGQKSVSPRGMEFLPAKVAHQENHMKTQTTMFATPDLHSLVKEALEGTVSKTALDAEAHRQLVNIGQELPEQVKQAAAAEYVPTDYLHKLANALDYMVKEAEESAKIQPGKGPNTLDVLEAKADGPSLGPGESGSAHAQVPMTPPMQSSGVAKDPPNAMETNDDMSHPEQPVDPMHNEGKTASALLKKNLAVLGITKEALENTTKAGLLGGIPGYLAAAKARDAGMGEEAGWVEPALRGSLGTQLGGLAGAGGGAALGALAGKALQGSPGMGTVAQMAPLVGMGLGSIGGAVGGYKALTNKYKKKEEPAAEKAASALFAKNLTALGLRKQAEDALNPANISGGSTQTGATPPEGVSASEESVPSEPSDVNKQKSMISSNDAAIDYTKREAKADPKKDVGHVVDEPALTSATDKVLQKSLAHTSEAGAKVASDLMRTAAAQALLAKLAAAKDEKKPKEKNSMGLDTPSGQSGFQASSVGPTGM